MAHPLDSITSRRRVFLILLACTLILTVVLNVSGKPLSTSAAPGGIVSFELAGSVSKAQEMLNSWDTGARVRAGFVQGLDFLYLCVYSTTIALGCLLAAEVLNSRGWPGATLGSPLAWGLWLAAGLDALENIALVLLLFGWMSTPWPQIAWGCALLKFGLIFLGLVYVFYALAVRLVPADKP